MPWISLFYFVGLGCISGLFAGLLGIGGGVIVVPGLFLIFRLLAFPSHLLMRLAIGTSLAAMIIASISSTISQQRKKAILWDLLKFFGPALSIGAIIGAVIAHVLSSHLLARIFGIFMIVLSIYLFLSKPPTFPLGKAKKTILNIIGIVIGTLGSLLGTGGGVFSVPAFLSLNVPIRNAVATSTASIFFTSIIGSVSYLILGWGMVFNKETLGYIYIPGFLTVGIVSLIIAPLGVKLSHTLPTKILKRIFAGVLIIIGIAMIFR